jgi:hypothetical protein
MISVSGGLILPSTEISSAAFATEAVAKTANTINTFFIIVLLPKNLLSRM